MSMITISRQVGSLGTEIARGVAEKLNYEYVDKEKIGKILADFGVGAPELEKFDEKKPPFLGLSFDPEDKISSFYSGGHL